MEFNNISGLVAIISVIISILVSFIQISYKRKAEDKFGDIIKDYLKKEEPSSKQILESMVEINQLMALRHSIKQASQFQQKWLENQIELNRIEREFLKLSEKLAENDKKLINEGLTQPSTTGRISYISKLLEKAKSET